MPHRPRDRSGRLAVLLAALLVATTVLAGPASAGGDTLPASPSPAAPAATPRYDGEALFRGLFFHQGPVAARHPELSRVPAAPTGAAAKLADRLVASMRQLEPGFFAVFEAGVTSGDRFRVRAALAHAGKLLTTAIERSGVGTAAMSEVSPGAGIAVAVDYAVAVYKVLTVATAANFVLAINFVSAANVYTTANFIQTENYVQPPEPAPPPPEPEGGSLSADQWVEQVAAALAR